jgi:signal transduction histidine kinase
VTLFLSTVAIFGYIVNQKTDDRVSSLYQLADIISANLIASIEFEDEATAQEIIDTFKLNDNIDGAFIFVEKTIFAKYIRDEVDSNQSYHTAMEMNIDHLSEQNSSHSWDYYINFNTIVIAKDVDSFGEKIATFVVISNTKQLQDTIFEVAITQIAISIIVLIVILLLSYKIQENVTRPIFKLKGAMEHISANKIDGISISHDSNDEFRLLYNGFNHMINRLSNEQHKLKRTKEELEALNLTLEQRVKDEIDKRSQQEQLLIQQSKMSAMGEMVGSIAHQWRQPLNVVALLVSDIVEAYEFDELDEEYMEKAQKDIMENIKFMSETIDDFRNFFRVSKEKEVFNTESVVKDVLKLYFHQSKNLNIDITLIDHELNSDELSVSGFKNEFKQVVLNLLNNARDILVEKEVNDKKINVEFILKDDAVLISVEDNGGGVPDDIIDKVFQPYFTTKHEGRGTGIGLYMSKTIIENNMGGELTVSNSTIGAKFLVLLHK